MPEPKLIHDFLDHKIPDTFSKDDKPYPLTQEQKNFLKTLESLPETEKEKFRTVRIGDQCPNTSESGTAKSAEDGTVNTG